MSGDGDGDEEDEEDDHGDNDDVSPLRAGTLTFRFTAASPIPGKECALNSIWRMNAEMKDYFKFPRYTQ